MIARIGAALAAAAAPLALCPAAAAGPAGYTPGPGLCDYPGVGSAGQILGAYFYSCDFPTEINSSHWHCEYGGFSLAGGGLATSGQAFAAPNILGAIGGDCSWRWPDNTPAIAPNPAGAWKVYMVATPAPPEHQGPPQPYDQTLPPGTPGVAMPPLPPPLGPEPPPPPPPEPLPPVTLPIVPNPLITQNPPT